MHVQSDEPELWKLRGGLDPSDVKLYADDLVLQLRELGEDKLQDGWVDQVRANLLDASLGCSTRQASRTDPSVNVVEAKVTSNDDLDDLLAHGMLRLWKNAATMPTI